MFYSIPDAHVLPKLLKQPIDRGRNDAKQSYCKCHNIYLRFWFVINLNYWFIAQFFVHHVCFFQSLILFHVLASMLTCSVETRIIKKVGRNLCLVVRRIVRFHLPSVDDKWVFHCFRDSNLAHVAGLARATRCKQYYTLLNRAELVICDHHCWMVVCSSVALRTERVPWRR